MALLALRAVGERAPVDPEEWLPDAVDHDRRFAADGITLTTVPPSALPSGTHHASLVLAHDLASVRRARTFVRHHCRVAKIGADTCETAVLLTSEAVTNAFIHGRSEARLRVRVRPGHVRVEVGDDNSRHPTRTDRDDDALDGRGLDILEMLSTRWGVDDDEVGKTVWFEVREPSTTSDVAASPVPPDHDGLARR
ncbi:hypothetical protein GCM10025868_21400 [Angustibacter aerolatus]|uniref:Histidine kinase/HSP90-like ATPase domain-containing protein n=1 Tax=Angustibacter aerolatus TaxID=1162965 RepID=A0ABQ6JJ90_9ACTN|nr:hypothetical protein GCM10025868_21400 [Angustibacter aerolatus]